MPSFGRSMLAHWWLDPALTYLNHGTVGATPRVVLEVQHHWQRRIEAQPAAFLFRELMRLEHRAAGAGVGDPARTLLRATAEEIGAFVGARGDDIVFVDNASTGINAVALAAARARGIEAQILELNGQPYVRLAAQVYNDESDYERLAAAIDEWPV